jgi:hypothetical protein
MTCAVELGFHLSLSSPLPPNLGLGGANIKSYSFGCAAVVNTFSLAPFSKFLHALYLKCE